MCVRSCVPPKQATYATALAIETNLSRGVDDTILGCILAAVNAAILGVAFSMSLHRHRRTQRESAMRLAWRGALSTLEEQVVDEVMGSHGTCHNEVDAASELLDLDHSVQQRKVLRQYVQNPTDIVLKKRIGVGSFGDVFEGTCLGETVGIKTMQKVTKASLRQFRAEILLTATLRHPNIIGFIGACWSRALCCLILEWAPRGSLETFLGDIGATQRVSWDGLLLRLASDCARGMAYLHDRVYYDDADGRRKRVIMHRDLKLANVLVTKIFSAKISDMGAAQLFNMLRIVRS